MSLSARFIKKFIGSPKLFSEQTTFENLASKRAAYKKLQRYFPVHKNVKIQPVKTKQFKAEWLRQPGTRQDAVLLYFHGGGFVFDSTKIHRRLVADIGKASKLDALSVDYSLSPENPFPVALNECLAAYEWLLKTYPSSQIALAGDSAGGSLVLSLLLTLKQKGLPYPACGVAICPATDAAKLSRKPTNDFLKLENVMFFIDAYFQKTARDHPVASPIYGDWHGLTPLLIHADTNEVMYPSAKRFVQKTRSQGVDTTFYVTSGLWHVWHMATQFVPEARVAVTNIGDYIKAHMS